MFILLTHKFFVLIVNRKCKLWLSSLDFVVDRWLCDDKSKCSKGYR